MNQSLSRGLSSFDMRHNLVTSFQYQIPTLNARTTLHALASGWSIAGIARFTTGLPVTLLNNNDTSLLGTIPNGINNNGVDTPDWSWKFAPHPHQPSRRRAGLRCLATHAARDSEPWATRDGASSPDRAWKTSTPQSPAVFSSKTIAP